MNKEPFYYYYMYDALQIYLLLTYLLTYLGKSDVYHKKNKYKR